MQIKEDTIFISVASYRDDQCLITIRDAFNKAKNPNNIFIGIVQQNSNDDPDCFIDQYKDNIRIMRVSHREAKGPCWARYLASTLWNGEQYFMQIDSHTSFAYDWDLKAIEMMNRLKKAGFAKPIMSHYPESVLNLKTYDPVKNRYDVPTMCESFFNDGGMISFKGAEIRNTKNEFIETPYMAAGFIFADYTFLTDVPFDPELQYLFVGEEILLSIRAWTSGYNIFTPTENLVFHQYTREDKPKIWTDKRYSDKMSVEKVRKLIGLENTFDSMTSEEKCNADDIKKSMDVYGLGKVRTLEQYYEFAGIDVKNKAVNKNFCREPKTVASPQTSKSRSMSEYCLILLIFILVLWLHWELFKDFVLTH